MRSAVFYSKGAVRIEEVNEPEIYGDSILVDVEWCGICGSDLHLYQLGAEPFGELTKSGKELPYALGHEFCGRLRSPPPASGFKDGDPVFVDPRLPCRQCVVCQGGNDYSCPRQGGIGYSCGGGLAERVAVPARNLHLLPATIPLQYAALIEPFAIAIHAINKTGITVFSDKNILVLGGGPVGFALITALRAYHPKAILVSEPNSARRALSLEYVDYSIDPSNESVVKRSQEISAGRGVDIVFDCAGSSPGLLDGLNALKCEGLYMNLAMHEEGMTLPVLPSLLKHVTIKFAAVYSVDDILETIKLIAEGRLRGYEKMVTSRIPIDDVVDHGFEQLIKNDGGDMKILVTPKSRKE